MTGHVLRLHWQNGSEAKDQELRNSGANGGIYIRRKQMDSLFREVKNSRVAVCHFVCAAVH